MGSHSIITALTATLLLASCSQTRYDTADTDLPPLETLINKEPGAPSPTQALHLMKRGDTAAAIAAYRRYSAAAGYDDFDLLKKMATILLKQGYMSPAIDEQLLTIYGAGIAGTADMLPLLHHAALSGNATIQLAALNVLNSIQNDYADEIINKSICSQFLSTRLEAIYYLASKHYPTALGQIEALMAKVPQEVQPAFPELLALEGSRRATALLRRLLNDSDDDVRREAIINAARYGRDDLLPDIQLLAADASSNHQEACAWALGTLKDTSSVDILKALSLSPLENISIAAAYSLKTIGYDDALGSLYTDARNGNIFALTLLGTLPDTEDLLDEIMRTSSGASQLNASLALLERRDSRCLKNISAILINESNTTAIIPSVSPGKALYAFKTIIPPHNDERFSSYVTATSLEIRKQLLTKTLLLPEPAFLSIAEKIFASRQNDLVPSLVTLLENLATDDAIALLKHNQQHPGAPLIRDYCNLALFRMNQGSLYSDNLEQWLGRQQDHPLIQFQTFIPWGMHSKSLLYELTPHETSQLLIESYQALAQSKTEKGVEALLDAIASGNSQNKYALAGLLIRAIE